MLCVYWACNQLPFVNSPRARAVHKWQATFQTPEKGKKSLVNKRKQDMEEKMEKMEKKNKEKEREHPSTTHELSQSSFMGLGCSGRHQHRPCLTPQGDGYLRG